MSPETKRGTSFDPAALDLVERRFWREIWESVPGEVAAEHGIELKRFGQAQASVAIGADGTQVPSLVLGAAEDVEQGGEGLRAAAAWTSELGLTPYFPVTPGLPGTAAAEAWLQENGFVRGYAWMKLVRDPHPPRFPAPEGVEVVEIGTGDEEPFGAIAALGFRVPAWGSELFAHLPGRAGWRCYVARIGGEAQACAAMLVEDGIAEFGIAATLEGARGHGCQTALLHRRILDAAEAGCRTLFVETGERVPERPSASYRNILRAGFEEAYLRPNWQRRAD